LVQELSAAQESIAELESANTELEADLEETEEALQAARAKRPLPNFVGDDEDSVLTLAEEVGWDITVNEQATEEESPGTVLSQDPPPGTIMRAGSTFSVVVAKAPPPGWKDVRVFSGQGEEVTATFAIPDGRVRVLYQFSGNTNAALTLYRKPRKYIDLLLNEIGSRTGDTRLYYSGPGYYFEICCGTWTVRVQHFY